MALHVRRFVRVPGFRQAAYGFTNLQVLISVRKVRFIRAERVLLAKTEETASGHI